MITKEKAIELLKEIGKCVVYEESGHNEHIVEYVNHCDVSELIAFIEGKEYDSSLEELARAEHALEYLENWKETIIKNSGENKYNSRVEEAQNKINDIKKHVDDVNNKTLSSFEDKSKLYKVKKLCRVSYSDVMLHPNRIVYIGNIEDNCDENKLKFHDFKLVNFLNILVENQFDECVVNAYYHGDCIDTFEKFNEFFEKV